MNNPHPKPSDEQRELLSAAADGEADALDGACQAWRSSAEARATWHRYHLIGDAMRSAELAQRPARDEAFLQAFRARMAAEPVVLAPAVAHKPAASRWWVPAAAAAGFAVVAGVVVMVRQSEPVSAAGPIAAASAPGRMVVIRDERLDEYLRAHQAARGGMGAALPGGAIRRVELEVAAPR